jgi:hypothetical protein
MHHGDAPGGRPYSALGMTPRSSTAPSSRLAHRHDRSPRRTGVFTTSALDRLKARTRSAVAYQLPHRQRHTPQKDVGGLQPGLLHGQQRDAGLMGYAASVGTRLHIKSLTHPCRRRTPCMPAWVRGRNTPVLQPKYRCPPTPRYAPSSNSAF